MQEKRERSALFRVVAHRGNEKAMLKRSAQIEVVVVHSTQKQTDSDPIGPDKWILSKTIELLLTKMLSKELGGETDLRPQVKLIATKVKQLVELESSQDSDCRQTYRPLYVKIL